MRKFSQRQYALIFLIVAVACHALANWGAAFLAVAIVSDILALGFLIRSFLPKGE
jgi:hypothetical protein